jgi:hypothetical protein
VGEPRQLGGDGGEDEVADTVGTHHDLMGADLAHKVLKDAERHGAYRGFGC